MMPCRLIDSFSRKVNVCIFANAHVDAEAHEWTLYQYILVPASVSAKVPMDQDTVFHPCYSLPSYRPLKPTEIIIEQYSHPSKSKSIFVSKVGSNRLAQGGLKKRTISLHKINTICLDLSLSLSPHIGERKEDPGH